MMSDGQQAPEGFAVARGHRSYDSDHCAYLEKWVIVNGKRNKVCTKLAVP